jgi:sterol desaturase/sphingolipid hydroxylase (fatty acid hydroxylase superfamily)
MTLAQWTVALVLLNHGAWAAFAATVDAASRTAWARARALHVRPASAAQRHAEVHESTISLAWYAAVQLGSVSLAAHGLSRLDLSAPSIAGGAAWAALFAGFVDAWWYWTHRWMHLPGVYRSVHRQHHRRRHPSPWASYAQSSPESVINAAPYLLAPLLLPFPVHSLLAVHLVLTAFATIGHCGFEPFPAAWRARLPLRAFNAATHHQAHHIHGGGNFGSLTALWDTVCGTHHADREA